MTRNWDTVPHGMGAAWSDMNDMKQIVTTEAFKEVNHGMIGRMIQQIYVRSFSVPCGTIRWTARMHALQER